MDSPEAVRAGRREPAARPPAQHPDLAAVARLADRHAAAGAAAGRLEPVVVAALREAGLFKMFLPADLGGLALPLPDAGAVIARVAEADAAAGWAVMIGAGPNWFAGSMEPALAAEVFAPVDSVVAGSGTPGRAEPIDDGWSVTGRWRWCSGSAWASWFTFGVVGTDVDAFVAAVPAAEVRTHPETWDVQGLRATASWDAELTAVVVPHHRTFRIDPSGPRRSEPLFRVPFVAFAQATMAAVSVGAARRVLAEFAALAAAKQPYGSTRPLAGDPLTADRLARATASCRAAAHFLDEATGALWLACLAGDPPSQAELLDVQLAACQAIDAGSRSARSLWDLSGMSVLPRDSALGRAMVDLQTLSQNTVVAAPRFADAGRSLLAGASAEAGLRDDA